jgi:rhodanese-related sulfurtransferase
MQQVPELAPSEFVAQWPSESKSESVCLLDVREDDELAVARVAGAVHIPMNEVPSRIAELERSDTIVVMCHVGGRSMRVAAFLRTQGFERVFNLRGGIDAWSREIDPNIPRY